MSSIPVTIGYSGWSEETNKILSMCATSNSTVPVLSQGSLVGRPWCGRPLAEIAFGVR